MLHFVLGTAGSGKTTLIYQKIKKAVESGREVLLIVPEQFSYESEKTLCALLGERLALNVQVLSFTRLCHKIFYKFGKVSGKTIGPTDKYLLMSIALDQVRSSLQQFQLQAGRASFTPTMLRLVEELKNAGVIPEVLSSMKNRGDRLSDKCSEIGLIYGVYQSLIEQNFQDPTDNIPRALQLCSGKRYFTNYDVFIDGFTAYMVPERKLISQMMAETSVTITACCDSLSDRSNQSLFASVISNVRWFLREANRLECKTETPTILKTNHRAQNDALQYLEKSYLRSEERFHHAQNAVHILSGRDKAEEIERIAREIQYLTLEQGIRYREIAVITRDIGLYDDFIQDVFSKYQIPVLLDKRENIEGTPLIHLILSALLAIKGSLDTSQILALSKSSLLGIHEEDACLLENYCYVWDVKGRMWQNEFTGNPEGFGPLQESSKEKLTRIENTRHRLMIPLLELRDKLKEPTGKNFAEGVYEYLSVTGALERMPEVCGIEAGKEYVDFQSALFDQVMDILDRFHDLLENNRLTRTRLIELFRLAIQSCDVGKLPQTADQVIAGSADRIRPTGIRVAFVCGASEGEFPLQIESGGLLNDREREALRQSGLELHTASGELAALERFYSYFALTEPSEKLYVSCPSRTLKGDPIRESIIIRSIRALFGDSLMPSNDPLRGITNRQAAFSLFCEHYQEDSETAASLRAYFEGSQELHHLNIAEQYVQDKNFAIDKLEIAEKLFGKYQGLSPSRLERYYGCAFSYFCESGIRLKTRRRVEYSPILSGTLIHYVLELMVRKYCTDNTPLPPKKKLSEEISHIIEEYLISKVEDASLLDKRFRYSFSRLVGTLCRLTVRLKQEFDQSGFRPFAFELPIRPDSANQPVLLKLKDGGAVYVQGVVDRVDLLERSDGKYIRVVDYKSGTKSFNLSDVYYGLNMQMLIYLFTLSQNGEERLRGAFPAGVLYMPAKEDVLTVERDTPPEKITTIRAKGYQMDGLLLDNISVLSSMEDGLTGLFIPAKLKKDGTLDSSSRIASLEEFGRLWKHIERLIKNMAERLLAGKVEALPVKSQKYDPCEYCEYNAICRHEEQHQKKELLDMDQNEVIKKIEEEDTHAGNSLDTKPVERN